MFLMKKVTITGIDDGVKHSDILEMTKKYPFVEWGILTSLQKTGSERYPSYEWTKRLFEVMPSIKKNFSLHICGGISIDLVSPYHRRPNWGGFNSLLRENFGRIQINMNIRRIKEANFQLFSERIFKLRQFYGVVPIIQHNKSNSELWKYLAVYGVFPDILFDSSGGRGNISQIIPTPITGYFCGYAGGLNPDNIVNTLFELNGIWKEGVAWIDVETGVRNDKNQLDLEKVDDFLNKCKPFTLEEYGVNKL